MNGLDEAQRHYDEMEPAEDEDENAEYWKDLADEKHPRNDER